MKKVIGKVHLWLGLASGLIVFIISITGCIYVFEQELKSWVYKDREIIDVPNRAVKKPLSELVKVAQQELGDEHPIQNIEVPEAADQTYSFRTFQIRNNKAKTYFGEIVYHHKVYVNPYTGKVVRNENLKYEFFTLILRLHRNLWLKKEIGQVVVGSSVIIFVVMLISGIVLWWPKNVGALTKRLLFKWKNTTKWKRKNHDVHSILGFYSSWIILVVALTGLTWAFDWFNDSVQWMANGGVKAAKVKPLISVSTQAKSVFPIDQILFDLKNKNPEAHTFTISFPEKSNGVVNASARSGVHVRYTMLRYQFDQFTGTLLKTANFDEKTNGEKLKAMNYDIHTGAIMGLPGKVLAFVASLISASLPITGFYIWWGRRVKNKVEKEIVSAVTLSIQSEG